MALVKFIPNVGRLSQVSKAVERALIQTADGMRTRIIDDQVLPFDEGYLQNIYTDVSLTEAKRGHVAVVHEAPYTNRLYYNPQFNFSNLKNIHARGLWWERYITGDRKGYARSLFRKYYKKEAGV